MIESTGIWAGSNADSIYIRVPGEAVHGTAVHFRKFMEEIIDAEVKRMKVVHLDMSETAFLDSTFVGVMLWSEKNLFATSGNHLMVNNPSPRCMEIIKLGGLHHFFHIEDHVVPEDVAFHELKVYKVDKLEKAVIVYEAHDVISRLSEEYAQKFSLVKKMLAEEIKRMKHDGSSDQG